jgi:hypothetical protein
MTRRIRSPDTWTAAEADYRAGQSARSICLRYDLGLSAFRERARKGGWRRADLPDPDPASADDAAPLLPAAALADMAHRRAAQALRAGHAVEAERWTRLHRAWARRAADYSGYTDAERAVSPPLHRHLGPLRSLAEMLGGSAPIAGGSKNATEATPPPPLRPVLTAPQPDSAAAVAPAAPAAKLDVYEVLPSAPPGLPDVADSPDTPAAKVLQTAQIDPPSRAIRAPGARRSPGRLRRGGRLPPPPRGPGRAGVQAAGPLPISFVPVLRTRL